MAENVTFNGIPNSNMEEVSTRWKYRFNFCREIGVNYLYGEKLCKVPERELRLMLGACMESAIGVDMAVMSVMRVIGALTRDSILDRPFYSFRQLVRRASTKTTLIRVLRQLVRMYWDNTDYFVEVVISLLTSRVKILEWDLLYKPDEMQDDYDGPIEELANQEDENDSGIPADFPFAYEEETENQENAEDGVIPADVLSMCEDEPGFFQAPQPFPVNGPMMKCGVVFLDAAELKEYQNEAIVGTPAEKERIRCKEFILPGPAFRDIDAQDPLAWADIVRENFGLNIRVEYVAHDKLPWLATSLRDSGLSKGDYYIVKYAVYFTLQNPALEVHCSTPGVMELYNYEMNRIRVSEYDDMLSELRKPL